MIKKTSPAETRNRRHRRLRKRLSGDSLKPRLCVFRSQKHIYAQLVDDVKASTLVSASSLDDIQIAEPAKAETVESAKPKKKGQEKDAAALGKSQKTAKAEAGAGKPTLQARAVGALVAKRAIEKGISEVVFDRGGFRFHGRIKALADGAREVGLRF